MKRKNLIFVLLTLTACTFVDIEKARKDGQEKANKLEEKHDVIETIKQYNEYTNRCKKGKFECISGEAFAIKGADLGCAESKKHEDYYYSDKCILFRREKGTSWSDYFDYKRFLPKNTKIKTETDFLKVAGYYTDARQNCYNIKKTESTKELTTQEKQEKQEQEQQKIQACHEKVEKMTLKMAMKNLNLKCMEIYETEYKELLERVGHRLFTYEIAGWLIPGTESYSTVMYSREPTFMDFGAEHGCDVSDWETEIRKYTTSPY